MDTAKAEALIKKGKIGSVAPGIYQAEGSKPGTTYMVEVNPPACDCMAFRFRRECKHIDAAMILERQSTEAEK